MVHNQIKNGRFFDAFIELENGDGPDSGRPN